MNYKISKYQKCASVFFHSFEQTENYIQKDSSHISKLVVYTKTTK